MAKTSTQRDDDEELNLQAQEQIEDIDLYRQLNQHQID